nr:heme-binding beta-barrel domain-containing protein [Candidatus Nitrospira nitrificans]
MGPVRNHEQVLYGSRYATVAQRIGERDVLLHEEVGYWLWDPSEGQVLRCFTVPRGWRWLPVGRRRLPPPFRLVAEVGSDTYGICSNRSSTRSSRRCATN